ncbi:MAG: hypothetical protein WCV84_00690 [Patescibacteria group bacterium]
MRFERRDRWTHIFLEGDESEHTVLRAVVKASFELARPVGMGRIHFRAGHTMTDTEADSCIMLPPRRDMVVGMEYVQGRQCKTRVQKVADGHFVLSDDVYEMDRGDPAPMLERAKVLLAGAQSADPVITSYMFKGESLTKRLKEYGLKRLDGESDWEFRKRVFPDLFVVDRACAFEFLVGASSVEWHPIEQMLYAVITFEEGGKPCRGTLSKFAKDFSEDPLVARERGRGEDV